MTAQETVERLPFFVDGGRSLHAWLKHMRDTNPVFFDESTHTWRVLRHADAVTVFADWATYSNDMNRVMPAQEFIEGNLSALDPPEHKHLRGLLSQGFTPRMLGQFSERINQIIDELLDQVAGQDEIDISRDLAYQLPLNVISELLGVPREDRGVLQRCADAQLSLTCEDPANDEFIRGRESAMAEMLSYLGEHSRRRRVEPKDDMISRLVHAEVEGRRLTETEIVNFSALLLLAGHLTTMGMLGNMMVCLHENPDVMAAIRADRSLIPDTIEEVLRYYPPVPDGGRVTNHEITLGDTTIPRDAFILISLQSANRDERAFTEPDRFIIGRKPNVQLAFTHGIHICLGAHLARLEGRLALNALLDRYSSIEMTELKWYETHGLCAPSRLAMSVQPAPGT